MNARMPGGRYAGPSPVLPNGLPLIGQQQPQQVPIVEFDGFKFPAQPIIHLELFKHAYLARRGDEMSAQLLTLAGVKMMSVDGKQYWPPADHVFEAKAGKAALGG